METNLEKAKRLIKANAAIQGIELPDNGFIFEMLELAATTDVVNKNFIKPDVRGQLIAFLRQQTKLHYIMIYENDFEFADKILKAINLP